MKKYLILFVFIILIIIFLNYLLGKKTQSIFSNEFSFALNNSFHSTNEIEIDEIDFYNLSFLDTILHGNRILFLGESTHYDAQTLKMKGKLIKYLHEKHGYDVILYEAGLYDTWLMNEEMNNPSYTISKDSIAAIGLWSFWCNNKESQPIIDYYLQQKQNEKKLDIGGFDIQFSSSRNNSTLIRFENMSQYLLKKGENINSYPQIIENKNRLEHLNSWYGKKISDSKKDSIIAELTLMHSRLSEKTKSIEDKIFTRYIKGIKNNYLKSWKYNAGSQKSMQYRDSLMAENLIWQIDSVYKHKKVIVWTSNVHSLFSDKKTVGFSNPLGKIIKERYGDNSYMMAFSSYAYQNKYKGLYDKASKKSLEYWLQQNKRNIGLIDLRNIPNSSILNDEFYSVLNQGALIKGDWSKAIDGIFYIPINYTTYDE